MTSWISKSLRSFRTYHKYLGITLAILLFISALTGIFLGWKKNVGLLQPPTQKGEQAGLQGWLPLDQICDIAVAALQEHRPEVEHTTVDRMDVRPGKGIVKVLFEKGWWEVQVDGTTGAVLSVARRHSDWIEKVHDGSIISDGFKLVSMNVLGIGILVLIITGLWLWYGPKRYRKLRRRR